MRPELPAGLDDQARLVAEAILLVSRGGSLRVTITGLADGERILDATRGLAAASGVRLVAVPSAARGGGTDVRVGPVDLRVRADDRLDVLVRAIRALRPIRVAVARRRDPGA